MRDQTPLRGTTELPPAYRSHSSVDLGKNRSFAGAVQVIFVLVALVAFSTARILDLPLASGWNPVVTVVATLVACLGYMAVHEATHGVVLRLLTRIRPTYAFRFPFLTTGSRAYLTRRTAIIVALAPCLIWGTVLLFALLSLPADYRLTTYILLTLNFAGSAGDYVEVYVVRRQQTDALVQDDADSIHIYVPEG